MSKTLFIECGMGCAGDMLMAALLELYDDKQGFLEEMNSMGLEGVRIEKFPAQKCGIVGTSIKVLVNGCEEEVHDHSGHEHTHACDDHGHHEHHEHDSEHQHEDHHEHGHADLCSIAGIINTLRLPQQVKSHALAVYDLLAQAESRAHGSEVKLIHFDEVGQKDAVADIVGVCYLMYLLSPDRVVVSPVCTGYGQIRSAHGILPVPAPATAFLLKDIPTYAGRIEGELCTPTGAALLKFFASEFINRPLMTVQAIGIGLGKRDFPAANCLRAYLGEEQIGMSSNNRISVLSCNLDDMTGEALGYASDILFEAGALDVFTQPINMKKGRPAFLLSCICNVDDSDKMAQLILKNTTTIGVRKALCERYILASRFETVQTKFGEMRIKISSGYGLEKAKPEYSDVAEAARKENVSFETVNSAAMEKFQK